MAPGLANLVTKAVAREKTDGMNGNAARTSPTGKTPATKKQTSASPISADGNGSPGVKKASASPFNKKPPPVAAASPKSDGDKVAGAASPGPSSPQSPTDSEKQRRKDAVGTNWTKVMAGVNVAAAVAKNARAAEGQKLFERTLVSAKTWDIFSPPPANSVSGKLVPRVLNRYKNRRKFSLEVHRVTPLVEDKSSDKSGKNPLSEAPHSYEECVARMLSAASKELSRKYKREALYKITHGEGSAEDFVASESDYFDEDDDDDASVGDNTLESASANQLADHGGKHFDGWKPKYSIPISGLFIRQQQKKTVHLLISIENVKQERDILFDTVDDAQAFCREVEEQKNLEAERQEDRLQFSLGDIKLPKFENLALLFEIVSGYDLPIGDFTTSDPYVVAMLGHQMVHRTKHISNTLDPIWTLKTGSLFLLTVESKKLFVEDGMRFIVKDFDQFGKDEILAICTVNPRVLYLANGERMEIKLLPPNGSKHAEVPGYLVIRCRRASEYDQKFMADYEKLQKKGGVASYDHPKSNTSLIKTMVTWNKRKEKDGTTKYKVRPSPDPNRVEETEWMTDPDIQAEVLKPSIQWLDIGQGELMKVYVEILGCDSLPNMDTGGFLGNKTDAFVSLVYGDAHVRTDVIDDCLSPRWMPWTTRAFILNTAHPSSQLFLGVFDYDDGPIGDHDLIGRVSVDLSNLRKETEYVLSYNLCPSARILGRVILGKITIRLRMEIPDERKLVLVSLEPPSPVYVNVNNKRDFNVIRQTCLGKYDEEKYSVSTLKSYIEELQELQYALFYLEDALMTLLLWRGHFELEIFGRKIKLPVHSFNAFVVATFLVEHPQLVPSFCFAIITWLLIAVMGWRRNSANVWFRCYSWGEIMKKLALGDAVVPPHNVEPFENIDEVNAETERWVKRIEEAHKKAEKASAEAEKEEEARLKEIGDADADIGTKVGGGISIDPVRSALFPVQLMLGLLCRAVRFVKNVVIWQEPYFSFWIATGSLALAIACVFVPWFWVLKWTSRLVVWTIFGPWMMLLDVYYFKPETEEEQQKREEAEKKKRKLATSEAADKARQIRENAKKMKVMKKYMFGKFAMRIPILKQDRYLDIPLPESTATPFKEKEFSLAELAMQEAGYHRTKVPGQTLVGDMIPMVSTDTFTQAPIGKATAHPEKLAKDAPGAGEKIKSDTTTTAYVKIGAVLFLAVFVSFFGTPLLVSILRKITHRD